MEIIAEMYSQANNHLLNTVPGLFEILLAYPESVTTGSMTLDLGTGSFYKLKLHGLSNVVKVYTATLEPSKCTQKKKGTAIKIYLRGCGTFSGEAIVST